jgi:membrane protein YdbS with pleckstrin-like domain
MRKLWVTLKRSFQDLWLAYRRPWDVHFSFTEPRIIAVIIFILVPAALILVYLFATMVMGVYYNQDEIGFVVAALPVSGIILFAVSWKRRRGQLYLIHHCEYCGEGIYFGRWDEIVFCHQCGRRQSAFRPKAGSITIIGTIALVVFLVVYVRPRLLHKADWQVDFESDKIELRTPLWFRSDKVERYHWGTDDDGDIGWVSEESGETLSKMIQEEEDATPTENDDSPEY